MTARLPAAGLYAITDRALTRRLGIGAAVSAAIAGGARVVQYRDKSDDRPRRRTEAHDLAAVCEAAGVPLIINDDLDLALAVGAAGVHLGRDDGDPRAARDRGGGDLLIGVSCYGEVERAVAAAEAGADYVAFGSFFASATKPGATPADTRVLREARRALETPIVAIGGITPSNAPALIEAGAGLLAVVSGVFGGRDPASAARAYARLFEPAAGNAVGKG